MKKGNSIHRWLVLLVSLLLTIGAWPSVVMADTVPVVSYCTHVQNDGWQSYVSGGNLSGTSGKSLRLEGIKIKLDSQGYDLDVNYQTHIQNIGWEADTSRGWKSNDTISGTEGLSYRLEAIQIKLTGSDADKFDIYYQVHAQNLGWLGWAKNGESAGTAGYAYRLEAIKIQIVPNGAAVPSGNVDKEKPFYENPAADYAQIIAEYQVAEVNKFAPKVINTLPDVTQTFAPYEFKQPLYYMLEDLSGDSIPELVIAGYDLVNTNNPYPDPETAYNIIDVYRLVGGTPERIFGGPPLGIRATCTICENNFFKVRGSGGAASGSYTFYKLNDNLTQTFQRIEYDTWKAPNYYLTDASHSNYLINQIEAYEIINSYVPRNDINWIKL